MKIELSETLLRRFIRESLDNRHAGPFKDYLNRPEYEKDLEAIFYESEGISYIWQVRDFLLGDGWKGLIAPAEREKIVNIFNRAEEEDDEPWEFIEQLKKGYYDPRFVHAAADFVRQSMYGFHDTYPTSSIMTYRQRLDNAWLLHFSSYADEIWKEGLRYANDDFSTLAYSGNRGPQDKPSEGLLYGFVVGRDNDYYDPRDNTPMYGRDAVLVQANAVIAFHHGDKQEQALFYNKDARNIMLIKQLDNGDWGLVGHKPDGTSYIVYHNYNIEKVARWAIANLDQYRRSLINPHESSNRNT